MLLLYAHIIQAVMQLNVPAKRDTRILVVIVMHFAPVRICVIRTILSHNLCVDSCTIKNGGCDPNAACSHHPTTNAVVCTRNTTQQNALEKLYSFSSKMLGSAEKCLFVLSSLAAISSFA